MTSRAISPRIIRWDRADFPGTLGHGTDGPAIKAHLDLTALYGEQECIRQLAALSRPDGGMTGILRTQNEHQVRAIDLATGASLWVSPKIIPATAENPQVSQLGVGDIDGDGMDEAIITSYAGDVICIATHDGSIKWHTRLPWHINNPRLDIKRALPGAGAQIALTVGNDFDWCFPSQRRRINFIRHPRLVLIDGTGEVVMDVPDYSAHNGNGHNVWMFDIDGDGLCEIFCSGHQSLLCYRGTGEKLFTLPCTGEAPTRNDTHPDDLKVFNWRPELPGLETIYLDGTDGIIIADSAGEITARKTFPPELASHLQNITALNTSDGPRLVAENIRAHDSKLLCLDKDLDIVWAAEMRGDMAGVRLLDWDGDGELEIVTGSHGKNHCNPHGVETAGIQVMKLDGTPCYWHEWDRETLAGPLASFPSQNGRAAAVVVTVATPNGPQGRFSLAEGHQSQLFVMSSV